MVQISSVETLEEFELVNGSLCVTIGRFDDFEGYMFGSSGGIGSEGGEWGWMDDLLSVLCEPDSGEVTPGEKLKKDQIRRMGLGRLTSRVYVRRHSVRWQTRRRC